MGVGRREAAKKREKWIQDFIAEKRGELRGGRSAFTESEITEEIQRRYTAETGMPLMAWLTLISIVFQILRALK